MKTCAIYVRKSILTEKGSSINNQISMCISYAREKNIRFNNNFIYCDEGYSGSNTNRPQFKKMLEDLKRGKFNTIICYRLDRISRSINDFSNLINKLEKYNTTFISIKENFDTNSPMGKSMMYIASIFSQLERETIKERIQDNLYGLAKSGRWLGGVTPTGFKSEPVNLLDNNFHKIKTYKLKVVDHEISLIKILFNKFLQFNSLSKLENYCSENNLKSKNGLCLTQNTLKQILMNPVYSIADEQLYDYLLCKGYSIYNKKSDFDGKHGVLFYEINKEKLISLSKHKGIVESKDWIYIQEFFLEQNKIPSRQGTSSIGLLSGLIYCRICNSLMRVKYGRKTTNGISFYYLCTLKERDIKSCTSKNLSGQYIDNAIFEKSKFLLKSEVSHNYLFDFLTLDRDLTKKDILYEYIIEDNFKNKNSNKYKEKFQELKNKLEVLEIQLKNNKNSSSYKYILEEIKLTNDKLNLIKPNLKFYKNKIITIEDNYLLSDITTNILNNIISDFNISNLNFLEKKYFLNHIIHYMYWDNFKMVIFFR